MAHFFGSLRVHGQFATDALLCALHLRLIWLCVPVRVNIRGEEHLGFEVTSFLYELLGLGFADRSRTHRGLTTHDAVLHLEPICVWLAPPDA